MFYLNLVPDELANVESMAFDWIAKNLYFTNSGKITVVQYQNPKTRRDLIRQPEGTIILYMCMYFIFIQKFELICFNSLIIFFFIKYMLWLLIQMPDSYSTVPQSDPREYSAHFWMAQT